ncbi:MAG: PilZ protein [Alphaproteobacteria bacterium]|nr:PilZ protein [Alphaproteobacteria bacterium]
MPAPTAAENQASLAADNRRVAPRTFLMLAANAWSGGAYVPVRIRNVSETGALIEGAGLPPAGEPIQLNRGEAQIEGIVAWSTGSRCGVHFATPIAVDIWRAGKPAAAPPGQGRVDLIQAAVRAGAAAVASAALPSPAAEERWADQLDARLAEELGFVQRLVEALGDELVADPAILNRHVQALQNIDLASQMLGHLIRVIEASDRAEAVRAIGMDDLRARLTRHRSLND